MSWSSLHWVIVFPFPILGSLLPLRKTGCLWGRGRGLSFSKYVYIFLLNLSENNYGSSSAEARTDVFIKTALQPCKYAQVLGSRETPILCFHQNTSLENQNSPPLGPPARLPDCWVYAVPCMGFLLSELGIKKRLGVKSRFSRVITRFKNNIKNRRKGIKG